MKCIKCDICGKYASIWRETKFSYWDDENKLIDVEEICLECVEIIEEKITEMVIKSKI